MMELISYVALLWAWFERLVASIPRFLLVATAAYVILYFATLALVAAVHRHWWRVAWFRRLLYWQFPLTLLGVVFCGLSRYRDVPWLWTVGTSLFSALTLYLGAFFIAALLMTPVVLGVLLYDRLRQGGRRSLARLSGGASSAAASLWCPLSGRRASATASTPPILARACLWCRSAIPTCPPS